MTPPILRVVFVHGLNEADGVWRTLKVSPFTAVPAEEVYAPLFLLYSPPDTETPVLTPPPLRPETVIVFETEVLERATPVTSVNVNWSGVVSVAVVPQVTCLSVPSVLPKGVLPWLVQTQVVLFVLLS